MGAPERGGRLFQVPLSPPFPASLQQGPMGSKRGPGPGAPLLPPPESIQPPQPGRVARGRTLSKQTRFSCPQMLILWGLMQKIPTFFSRRCA